MRASLWQKIAIGSLVAAPAVVSILAIGFRHITALAAVGIVFNLFVCVFLFELILHRMAQRQRAENTLRESEERFRQLVQHAGDIIYRTDRDGRFTFINQTVETLTGYKPEELLGHHFLEPVAASAREEVAQFYRQQFAELTPNTFHYFPALRKDGSEIWIAQNVQLVFAGRKVTGAQGVARDATLRVQLQQELARARDAALESARVKSEFVATTSHEIRTPMHGLIGMTNLLADTKLDTDQTRIVENIQQSAEELLHFINHVLDFSKIESGRLQIEAVDFDLHAAVQSVINIFVEAAESKNLTLTSVIAADVPAFIHADTLRLRQILINLVGNALKFTHSGEVGLTVKCSAQTETDVVLRFEVSDTGIGISEEAQARLFNAFVQADESTARKFEGSGLGLAISKQLVEAMGGEIGVASRPGEGSTFWFTLKPVKASGSTAPEVVEPAERRLVGVPKRRLPNREDDKDQRLRSDLRLLIVEDNPINREVARYQLENIGYLVDLAQDSSEALEMLDRHEYALILMDCHLPGVDGFETAARIRRRTDNKRDVPIIAVTASALPADREKCRQAGMNDFMLKPFRQEQLSEKIANWLSPSSSADANSKSSSQDECSPAAMEVTAGLKQLEEDYGKEMALKIVEMFVPDAEARLERIERAIERQDYKELEEAAHGLKSGAANIGAMVISRLCEVLETRGEVESQTDPEQTLARLRESWATLKTQIATHR